MQKDSAQAKISLKVVGGLLFLTHPVGIMSDCLMTCGYCAKSQLSLCLLPIVCCSCRRMQQFCLQDITL